MNAEHRQAVRKLPSLLHTLGAPVAYGLLPRRAAEAMAGANRRDFIITYLSYVVLVAGTVLWLAIEDATYEYTYARRSPAPTTTAGSGGKLGWVREVRTEAEVWRDWHSGDTPWWGPAEWILAVTLLGGTLGVGVLAWLYLVRVHRSGAVWPSYQRSFRAVSSGLGLVWILVIVCYGQYVYSEYDAEVPRDTSTTALIVFLQVPVFCWFCVLWLGRAVTGVEDESLDLDLPPRCEGCGYDLTHRPLDGRCSECGLDVEMSLTPGRRRPGSKWMNSRGWLASAARVLFSPQRFYEELQLRTPGSTERGFAAWNFLAMFVGALVWAGVLVASIERFQGLGPDINLELLVIIAATAMGFVLGCWLLHRTIAALVVSFRMLRWRLPDHRWTAKVAAYESVSLWFLAAYLGLLLLSFIIFEDWISALFGRNFPASVFLGMPGEVLAAFCGPVAYVLLAFWRYGKAYQAIRWSNF